MEDNGCTKYALNLENRLNDHIMADHAFQLEITKKLTEITVKMAFLSGVPSIVLLIYELFIKTSAVAEAANLINSL